MILLLAPYLVCWSAWAVNPVVADPPTAAPDAGTVAPAATGLTNTDTQVYNPPSTNTVSESAEQDTSNVITNTTTTLMQAILTRESGRQNDVYNGLAAWAGDDIFTNLFSNIGQVIGRWLSEFIDGWVSSTVQFLSSFLRTFVLNPNIAVSGVQNTPGQAAAGADDISPYVREAAGTMYGIAIDLLLLLFILCIWKFWAEAAWRGGGHILGAVGRLIFTAGLMLAWPTIYAFEIQITNEMIQAIYFTGGDQITQLDVALTAAVKAGLVATTGLLANAFAPVIGGAVGGAVGGTVGGLIAFAGLVIYLILGVVLITQIVYILVLKAIQTGLLTAQYMFAPIFLVFFATPDTENITAGFVRSFCEVSLWTFVWVGLLKIMVIILYSQFNPWGKITMAVGILQIMIQVPTFLARAQISPMSDFISAGLITGGLMKGASALANKASGAMTQFSRYVTGDMYGARGMPTSKKVGMENTPTGAANPELMESLKGAGKGVTPGGVPKKDGAPGALGKDIESPLSKKPAATDEDAMKKKLAESGLGAPEGKHVSPIGATPESASAAALKKMTPAEMVAKAKEGVAGSLAMGGLGAGVGAAMAATEASKTMGGEGGTGTTGPGGGEGRGLNKEEKKGVVPPAGVPPAAIKKPLTEAEKAAAAKGMVDLGTGKDVNTQKGEGDGQLGVTAAVPPATTAKKTDTPEAAALKKNAQEKSTTSVDPTIAGKDLQSAGATGEGKATTEAEKLSTAQKLAALQNAPLPGIKKSGTNAATDKDKAPANLDGKTPVTPGADATGKDKAQQQTVQSLQTGDAKGEEIQGVHTNVKPVNDTKEGPPKVTPGDTKAEKAEDKGQNAAAPPANALAGGLANAAGITAASRVGRLFGGPTGGGDRTIAGAGSPKEGAKTEQTQTARVLTSGGPEDQTGTVNTIVTAEGSGKGAQGQLKQTAGTTTTSGGTTNPDGTLNLAALAATPPIKQAGDTAVKGRRGMSDGSRSIEQASSRPSVNNGFNTDPTTVNQAVKLPAGSVEDRGNPTVNVVQESSSGSKQGRGAAGNPTVRTMASGGGNNDFNPAAAAISGLPGVAAGVAMTRGGGNGNGNGGGPRNLSMPGGGGGGGNGGPGGHGPTDSAYVSFPASPAPGSTRGGQAIQATGMQMFDQSNYRWVPGRTLLTDIRTAAGPQQGDAADGQSAITMGQRGVASVRYGQGATSEQKALMLMTAGYAGVFSQDPAAFDAARQSAIDAGGDQPKGFAQRIAANWMQYSGGSFKSTAIAKNQFQQALMEQATLGAESYVNGGQGNAYTSYLRGRYGAMTSDQQAWGMHITSDPTSPESGWSTTVGPATDTLVKAGMPITAENRAAASNQAVMRQPQWARGQAVRGVAAYLGAMADESLGPNAHPLERDAFVGRLAPQLSSETVEACRAIVAEAPNGKGADLCANPSYVNSVASLMSSPYATRKLDASTAFRNMSGVLRAGNNSAAGMQTVDVMSSNGGGGGGFIGNMGGMAAPPMIDGSNNAIIDTQFRNMSGGGGGNFNVPGASVYAPVNNALGNTIVRGSGGLGFANQTVHASVDVLPGHGNNNFNMPSNLGNQIAGTSQTDVVLTPNMLNNGGGVNVPPSMGTQLGPNITQVTDYKVEAVSGGDDNQVHVQSVNISGVAGRQQDNFTGGLSGPNSVNHVESVIYGEVLTNSGAPSTPSLNQLNLGNSVTETDQRIIADVVPGNGPVTLPSIAAVGMQNVQSQVNTSVTMGNSGGGGRGGAYVQQGLAQVYLNPTSNASQQSNALNNSVAQMGAQAAHSYASNYQSAQQIVIEMMRAGFDDNSIQNPQIAAVAMQTFQQDPSMLGSAAICSKIMQPQEVTMSAVQSVQMLVDYGSSPKSISREEVIAAQQLVQVGVDPTPQNVRMVRQSPSVVSNPSNFAASRGATNRIPSDLIDALLNGGNDRDGGGGGGRGRR